LRQSEKKIFVHRGSQSNGNYSLKSGVKISNGNKGVCTGNVYSKIIVEIVPMEIKGSDIVDLTIYFTSIHRKVLYHLLYY
jgi:hypothetical protein